ncbi:MAG: hypothetical protein KDB37_13105, partial [Ilumatobacter sp.]|nr:hypothetical protein [Ilumatobacter sp.]
MADPDPTRSARTRGIVLAVSVGFVTLCSIVGFFGSGRRIIVVQPGGATFDDRVLPVFFLAFFATAIVSWRWPRIGGVLALFVVAGFVPFAINQLEPWSAVVTVAVFGIPALLWTALGATRRTTADPDLDPDADPDDAPDLGRRRFLLTVAGGVVAVV